MDEPWDTAIAEYGALNVTGFRLVDPSRRVVRDFLTKWSKLDGSLYPGSGHEWISAEAALMVDAVSVLSTALGGKWRLQLKNGSNMVGLGGEQGTGCREGMMMGQYGGGGGVNFEQGERLAKAVRKVIIISKVKLVVA
jgi:ionotropic glutamate receptor